LKTDLDAIDDEDKKRLKNLGFNPPPRRASVIISSGAKKRLFSMLGVQSMNVDLNLTQ